MSHSHSEIKQDIVQNQRGIAESWDASVVLLPGITSRPERTREHISRTQTQRGLCEEETVGY